MFRLLLPQQVRALPLALARAYSTGGDYQEQQGEGFADPTVYAEGNGPAFQPAVVQEVYEVR